MNPFQPIPNLYLGSGLDSIPADVGGICVVVSRDEVDNPRVGRSVDDLMHLCGTRENTERFASAVLLVFDGYNDDPRAIHEIPECRQYLSQLHAQWPYWMHFLAPIPDQWSMLLLSLLPRAQRITMPNGAVASHYDEQHMRDLLLHLTSAMNNLHKQHGIERALAKQVFDDAIAAIDQCTAPDPTKR
jgi:hypothetical protein